MMDLWIELVIPIAFYIIASIVIILKTKPLRPTGPRIIGMITIYAIGIVLIITTTALRISWLAWIAFGCLCGGIILIAQMIAWKD